LHAVLEKVDELERDHREADALHRRVDELGTAWLDANELSAADLTEFRNVIAKLGQIYPDDIEIEDAVLFPAAARVLSPEQKAEIAAEMAGRRSVKLANL
jgi:hemerythrin-like domain-containing protein